MSANPQRGLDWLVAHRDLLDDADFTAAGTNGYTVSVQVGSLDSLVGLLTKVGVLVVPEPYLHGKNMHAVWSGDVDGMPVHLSACWGATS